MVSQGKAGQAYQRIEQLIVSEELTPGNLVSEAVLMEKTGLGRTPIREALQQLARNRMVEIHPNRGVLIPPASVEAQLRMLEVRRVLEALAVRLACHSATGRVSSSSSVPPLASSAHMRMVTAGTRIRYSHGCTTKNGCRSA